MEENKPMNSDGHMHDHMGCCHGFGHKHFLLRLLLGIAILAVVFCLGMRIGEFKGEFRSGFYGGYGRPMMGGYDSDNAWYGPGMMRTLPVPPATAPATNTAPTNK